MTVETPAAAAEQTRGRPSRVALTVSVLAVAIAVTAQATMTTDPGAHQPAELLATVLRVLSYLAAAGTVGTLAVALLVAPESREDTTSTTGYADAATVWAVAWSAVSLLSAGAMMIRSSGGDAVLHTGEHAFSVIDGLAGIAILTAWAAGTVALLTHARRRGLLPWAYVVGLAGLAGLVLSGHSAEADRWGWALLSIGLHVAAIAAWFGGLVALALRAVRVVPTPAQLRRFSSLALVGFLVVGGSGVLNAVSRLSWAQLTESGAYAFLLLTKVAVFGLLGVAGAVHRSRSIAWLEGGRAHGFWLLVAGELVLLTSATGLGVVLARTGP